MSSLAAKQAQLERRLEDINSELARGSQRRDDSRRAAPSTQHTALSVLSKLDSACKHKHIRMIDLFRSAEFAGSRSLTMRQFRRLVQHLGVSVTDAELFELHRCLSKSFVAVAPGTAATAPAFTVPALDAAFRRRNRCVALVHRSDPAADRCDKAAILAEDTRATSPSLLLRRSAPASPLVGRPRPASANATTALPLSRNAMANSTISFHSLPLRARPRTVALSPPHCFGAFLSGLLLRAKKSRVRPVDVLVGHHGVDGGLLALRFFTRRLCELNFGLSQREVQEIAIFLAADAGSHRNAKAVDIAKLCRHADQYRRMHNGRVRRKRVNAGL